MKKIALKPITFIIPRDASPELARMLQRAEETLRENNALIEQTINNLIKETSNNGE